MTQTAAMPPTDSQLRRARSLLAAPVTSASLAGLAAAAGLFALSALALAATVVMMPTPWPT